MIGTSTCTYVRSMYLYSFLQVEREEMTETRGKRGSWIGKGPERILQRRSLQVAAVTSWNTRGR